MIHDDDNFNNICPLSKKLHSSFELDPIINDD